MRKTFYDRQTKLAEIGDLGQEKISRSRVLIVGVGGLGCASANYLVRAGVGSVVIVDPDRVNESDLARQTLYTIEDISRLKAEVAAEHLGAMNPEVEVIPMPIELGAGNIELLARNCDVMLDGTDELSPRESMNSHFVSRGVPVVFAGAVGWNGYVTVVRRGGPCFHCIWGGSDAAPRCTEAGIIGPVVGAIGCFQAVEAIKMLVGKGSDLSGRLMLYDGLAGHMRVVKMRRNNDCPVCGSTTSDRRL